MTARLLALACAALAVVAAVLSWWPGSAASPASASAGPPASAPDAPKLATIAPTHAGSAASAPARPAAPAAGEDESVAARVDRLSRSSDPVDQFSAYTTIAACVAMRRHETELVQKLGPEMAATQQGITRAQCGNLASDQVQGRRRLLERPLAAGLHGAALALYWIGPDGNGPPEPQDADLPQYADWRAAVDAAYANAFAACDATAFDDRANRMPVNGATDAIRQLTWRSAAAACVEQGKAVAIDRLGMDQSHPTDYAELLPPAQVDAAVAAGRQLATNAHGGP